VSTILKALRRVEEERAGTPAPRRAMRGDFVEGSQTPPALKRQPRRTLNFKLWGSLACVVLLAALVWWRLPRMAAAPVAQALPPAEAERRAPAAPPPAPAQAPTAPAQRLAQRLPAAAPAPPQTGPAPNPVPDAVAERLPPLGSPLEAPPPAPSPAPEPVATRPEPAPSPPPAAAPIAAKPALTRPTPPKPAATPAAKPKPTLVAVAPSPKPALPSPPTVQIERTSWHPTPARRIAWVRVEGLATMRELHEGDAVGALVVKEIKPSSVLFQYGSVEIQRRVGEK
jgi:hypothetical protein